MFAVAGLAGCGVKLVDPCAGIEVSSGSIEAANNMIYGGDGGASAIGIRGDSVASQVIHHNTIVAGTATGPTYALSLNDASNGMGH
jgi:hypothetical protein